MRKSKKMFSVRRGKVVFADTLIERIKKNQYSEVQTIIGDVRYPEDIVDSDRTTLLHLSAKYNNEILTKHLLDSGCDVDAKNNFGETPLLWAVRSNSFKAMKQLLGKNADIYYAGPECKSILEMILTSEEEIPIIIVKYLFAILKNDCQNEEELADMLTAVHCPLYYIVLLKNAQFTRKMLRRVCSTNARKVVVYKDSIWALDILSDL